MKRALIMVVLSLFPRILAAQPVDISELEGENWYGLYLNGQKSGYAMNDLKREADGAFTLTEDVHFRLSMVGVPQDMRTYSKRYYSPEGKLKSIESEVQDIKGLAKFLAVVEGDELVVTSTVGGQSTESRMPAPEESIMDALKQVELVHEGAKVGDRITFTIFEPMMKAPIDGSSQITGIENRMFEGALTKVFKIKTNLESLGIETLSYVTENGITLEDITAGMITMRLEPKEIAQDVTYSNDVIVSNAALVDTPIADPRNRKELRLKLSGPISAAHLFNDERQFLAQKTDGYEFTAKAISLDGFTPAQLPIADESVAAWIKPSLFVQSDDPKFVEKAREIIGTETDSLKISTMLSEWVYKNVHTTFSARLTNALEVLASMEGDCTEHSILFIALARAAGLPAREVAGLIYVDSGQPGFYFHQWAKVWIGKWIDVDPTFNQPLADVTHIKLAEGDLFQQAQIIPIIGQLKVEVLETESGG